MTRYYLPFLFLLPIIGLAQEGPNVNPTVGPPMKAFSRKLYRDGSSNVQYVCTAPSKTRYPSVLTVSDATNASPIVITTEETHGLSTDNEVIITKVVGNTAANGTWTITVLSSTTFSLNSSTGNAGYTSGGSVTTYAPRSNAAVWSIQRFYYTSTYLDSTAWASGSSVTGYSCDDRATLSYQ